MAYSVRRVLDGCIKNRRKNWRFFGSIWEPFIHSYLIKIEKIELTEWKKREMGKSMVTENNWRAEVVKDVC